MRVLTCFVLGLLTFGGVSACSQRPPSAPLALAKLDSVDAVEVRIAQAHLAHLGVAPAPY